MPDPAIAAEIHEALDAHGYFSAQITFDRKSGNRIANSRDLGLAQILDLGGRVDACACAHFVRARATDAMDVRQCHPDVFVDRDIDPCNTCHRFIPDAACAADPCI